MISHELQRYAKDGPILRPAVCLSSKKIERVPDDGFADSIVGRGLIAGFFATAVGGYTVHAGQNVGTCARACARRW